MAIVKIAVVPPLLVRRIGFDLLAHFLDLEDNHGVVLVTFAVVFRQNLARVFLSILSHKPARRLGQEPDSDRDDD